MEPIHWHRLLVPTVSPWEVALRAALIYIVVQALLRLAGRKRLARTSVFDASLLFLITVAARRSIVKDDDSLTTAVLALAVLFALDWLLSRFSSRSEEAARVLEGEPRQLVRDGRVLEDALAAAQLGKGELMSQLRLKGHEDLSRVRAAYLEPNGQVSFLFEKDG